MWPSAITTPAARHAATAASALALVMVKGFSTKTCLPARAAAMTWSACIPCGEAMAIACTAGSASTASKEGRRRTPCFAAQASARSGRLTEIDGDRFLVLENGQQLDLPEGDSSARLIQFDRLETKIDTSRRLAPQFTAQATDTLDLLREPDRFNLAELAWRLGLVWASINLCLLALAVARINPRAARSGQILLGLFAFIIYYNLINLGQSSIANGKTHWLSHIATLHGSISLLALAVLTIRNGQWHWRLWPTRKERA